MQVTVMGIDIGKSAFHIIGLSGNGSIVLKKKFSRAKLLAHTANMPSCLIGMEGCCGAHYLGRALTAQGHQVRLMPAQYVRPYVKSNKNDFIDAEAIAEAVQRPRMRFVPLKTDEQLDLQALHRVRDRLMSQRTALINQIRAFLLERGITLRQGAAYLRNLLPSVLEEAEITPSIRQLLAELREEWAELEEKIERVDQKMRAIVKESIACQNLLTVPGVGAVTATALVASIGNGAAFEKGRSFAAWLGLVPRQYSTGGKPRLLGISKRGHPYLRKLFVLGAQSMMMHMSKSRQPYAEWVTQLAKRAHRNVVVIALANKIARIAWAVLNKQTPFRQQCPAIA